MMQNQSVARITAGALCREPARYPPPTPEITRPRRGNVEAAEAKTQHWKPKRIKLPKRAQHELRALKRRLIEGCFAGTYRPAFVSQCFNDFPELVSA
jgi:hypothetical protein